MGENVWVNLQVGLDRRGTWVFIFHLATDFVLGVSGVWIVYCASNFFRLYFYQAQQTIT